MDTNNVTVRQAIRDAFLVLVPMLLASVGLWSEKAVPLVSTPTQVLYGFEQFASRRVLHDTTWQPARVRTTQLRRHPGLDLRVF